MDYVFKTRNNLPVRTELLKIKSLIAIEYLKIFIDTISYERKQNIEI